MVKVTELTADTSPTGDDLLMGVNAPGSSPASRKWTVDNTLNYLLTRTQVWTGINSFGAGARADDVINLENNAAIGFENVGGTANETIYLGTDDIFKVSSNWRLVKSLAGPSLQTETTGLLADDTIIGSFVTRAQDGLAAIQPYIRILGIMESDVDTAEQGSIAFEVLENGINNVRYAQFNDAGANRIDFLKPVTVPTTTKIFLDGGGNTSIRESSADIVVFEIGGADKFWIQGDGIVVPTNNALYLNTGGTSAIRDVTGDLEYRVGAALQHDFIVNSVTTFSVLSDRITIPTTNRLYLDGGGNTSIRESSADVITFETGGIDSWFFTNSSFGHLVNGQSITSTGTEFIFEVPTGDSLFWRVNGVNRLSINGTAAAIPTGSKLFLDGSLTGNTSIRESATDVITFETGASDSLQLSSTGLTVKNTTQDMTITIFRDDATPTVDDFVGIIKFDGKNNLGTTDSYFRLVTQQKSITDGAEESYIFLQAMDGGVANTSFLEFNSTSGLVVTYHDFVIAATKKLYLDGFGDTSIRESAANQMAFEVAGSDRVFITATTLTLGSAVNLVMGSQTTDRINLPNNNAIGWENSGGTANFTLKLNTLNEFEFNSDVKASNVNSTAIMQAYRNDTTPVIGVSLGRLAFKGDTDTVEDIAYAQIEGWTRNVTNATSAGSILLRVRDDNVNTTYIDINGETRQTSLLVGDFTIPATQKLFLDGGGNTYIHEVSADKLEFVTGGTSYLQITNGSLIQSGTTAATTKVNGFLYLNTVAGTPTGVPTTQTGSNVAMTFDTTNNILYVYDGGWVNVGATSTTITPPLTLTGTIAEGSIRKLTGVNTFYYNTNGVINPQRWNNLLDNTLGLYRDDYTTYANDAAFDTAYPTISGTEVNPNATNDRIDFTMSAATIVAGVYFDLGENLDNAIWTVRFALTFTTLTANTTTFNKFVQLILSDNTGAYNATQDYIGLILNTNNSATTLYACDGDNSVPATATQQAFATSPSTTTYYVEIERTSTTAYNVKLFSDSGYSSLIEAETGVAVASTVTSLRYFKVLAGTGATNGNITGYVRDLQVWNKRNAD